MGRVSLAKEGADRDPLGAGPSAAPTRPAGSAVDLPEDGPASQGDPTPFASGPPPQAPPATSWRGVPEHMSRRGGGAPPPRRSELWSPPGPAAPPAGPPAASPRATKPYAPPTGPAQASPSPTAARRRPQVPPYLADAAAPTDPRGPGRIGAAGPLDPRRLVVDTGTAGFEPLPVPWDTGARPGYRPDTVLDAFATRRWTLRAACCRGDGHRYGATPRQDDMALGVLDPSDVLIVAVADGVSACPESHHAAFHVTRKAVALLVAQLTAGPEAQPDWEMVVEHCAHVPVQLTVQLLGAPEPDPDLAVEQLSCTLSTAVVRPAAGGRLHVEAVTIGDSAVGALCPGGLRRLQGGKDADGGVSSSAVTGLPRRPPTVDIIQDLVEPDEVLLVGSDGIWDPLGDGTGLVGRMLREALLPTPPSLAQFGRVADFSRETWDDDRTLVAVWPDPGAATPGSAPEAGP